MLNKLNWYEDFRLPNPETEDGDIISFECIESFEYHISAEQAQKNMDVIEKFFQSLKPSNHDLYDMCEYLKKHYIISSLSEEDEIAEVQESISTNPKISNNNDFSQLEILAFKIENEGKGQKLYQAQKTEHEEAEAEFIALDSDYIKNDYELSDILVYMELNSGEWQVEGSSQLSDELFLFKGVTSEDLEDKNNKLLYYCMLLKKYNL